MIKNISCDIFSNTAAGRKINPLLPSVSLLQAEGVSPAPLAADSLTDGIILPWKPLYILPAVKTGISEIATRYNRFLGGLTLWVGEGIPCQRGIR